MRRRTLTGLVAAGACALTVVGAQPALAVAVTTNAKAYSAGTAVGTASLQATLSLTGTLGGLLNGLLTPIVNNALNPLVAALQGTASTLLSAALGSSSNYTAGTPTDQSTPAPGTFPTDLPTGLPSPCSRTSLTKPCYTGSGGVASVTLPAVATVTASTINGYTQQVQTSADATNPIFGRAEVANVGVTVLPLLAALPNPIVSTGTVDSKSVCPNAGSTPPSALVSASQVRLLNGAIALNVAATGGVSSVVVGASTYTLDNLPNTTVAGFTLSKFASSALKLSLPLSISQVIAALGLSGTAVDDLINSVLPNRTLTLSVIAGPTVSTTASSAQAAGLSIGVDLAGSLGFDLLGLVGATVTVPTGIGGGNYGNVLDARLGFSSCSTGTTSTGSVAVVPPALI